MTILRKLLLCLLLSCEMVYPSGAITLPGGFEQVEVLNGLQDPATMAFSPDGRLFIAERIVGRLRVASFNISANQWELQSTPFAAFDVPPARHRSSGLRGFAFDPNFAVNGFVYAFYMKDSPRHNRVVRIQANPANPDVALPGETLLMEVPFNTTESSGSHNGGAVQFGSDDKLYFTTGDGWNGGDEVQSLSTFVGKLFRINSDGSIPADNPFYGQTTGAYRAIYALGLRNPFSMSRHPVSGQLYINDVGGNDKSEINKVAPAANFGHDGFTGIGTTTPDWANGGDKIITGGAWYPIGGPFPSSYYGNYFVPLWNSSAIRTIASEADSMRSAFATSVAPAGLGPMYTLIGNDGYLYYLTSTYETSAGTVYMIRPSGGSAGPTVTVTALDPTASEQGQDPGLLRLTRTSEGLTNALTVQVNLTGTASPADYSGAGGSVLFPANSNQVDVIVTPVDDGDTEADETLDVTILHSLEYNAGNPFSATITITDNDLPLRAPDIPGTVANGLEALYYEGVFASADELAPSIPVQGTVVTDLDLAPALRSDNFGLRFLGYIDVPTNGVYAFYTESDAGSVLRIGSTVVVDNDGVHALATESGLVGMEVGKHLIEVSYFETTGTEALQVQIEGPNLPRQDIPSSWLCHEINSTPYGLTTRPAFGAYLNGVFPDGANGSFPATLSEVNAFTNLATLEPIDGLLSYDVNSPLWSDGATKLRWAGVPTGTTVDFYPTDAWSFPTGTVLVKHFDLQTVRLETRFMVHGTAGWYGVTYKWRTDQADADLLPGGDTEDYTFTELDGSSRIQTWSFPDRNQCLECHNALAGPPLGLNTRQLNRDWQFGTGITDNLLRTWGHVGLFTGFFHEGSTAGYDRLASVDDSAASAEHRVRSYIDVNCALCHQPGGEGYNAADMRFITPLLASSIINGDVGDIHGMAGAKVVAPADPDRSMMLLRMQTKHSDTRMPPIASSEPHREAIATLVDWINGLTPIPTLNSDGLEAAWPLDEGSGIVAMDVGGNAYHGTLVNMATTSWLRDNAPNRGPGTSLQFDGVNDYVDAGMFTAGSTGLTLTGWIKADAFDHLASRDGRIISKADGINANNHNWMLSTIASGVDTRLRFRVKTGGTTDTLIASGGNLQTQVWTHVAAVYDGTNMRLYKDGVQVGSQSKTGAIDTEAAKPVWIGGNPPTATERPFSGQIDEVRVYSRALDSTEIQDIMNGADAMPVGDSDGDNLVDAWEFIYFGNLNQANVDTDGDGLLNSDEWIGGHDPTDPASDCEIQIGDSGVAFTARRALGASYGGWERRYSLQCVVSLVDGTTWQDIPGYTNLSGNDQLVSFPIFAADTLKYFRLKTWLVPR